MFPVNDGVGPAVERPAAVQPLLHTWNDTQHGSIDVLAAQSQQHLGTVPTTRPEDVSDVVDHTRSSSWASTTQATRTNILEEYQQLLFDHSDALLDIIQLETGKTRDDAYLELLGSISTARYYANSLDEFLASESRSQPLPFTSSEVQYEPFGTVGVILPWNYPLALGTMDVVPALAAGNSVVVKPSEQAPYTVLYMCSLLLEAGVPADALQLVIGEGDVGSELVGAVDVIAFTGSTKVGKLVAKQAAESLTPTSLELGGKNPLLILDSADVSKAVRGTINASFNNAGQLCVATERTYVHEDVYDEYIDGLRNAVSDLDVGIDYNYGGEVGVLISTEQHERVKRHVDEAIDAGATVVAGGESDDTHPTGFKPTILTDVDPSLACVREETFGPVVTVEKVSSVEEMVRKANDMEYGLHASIWGDSSQGTQVAQRIDAGTVAVNDGFVSVFSTLDSPMGGWKESGLGRRNGPEGIKRYLQQRTVSTTNGPTGRRPSWFPPRLYERIWEEAYNRVPWLFDR